MRPSLSAARVVTVFLLLAATICALPACAQTQPEPSPWKPLEFLLGTWEAHASGAAGADSIGSYTFGYELKNHVLARHSKAGSCKGPANFNCSHSDLFYVYEEDSGLKAIYFDNEGHVIHYVVSSPQPGTAVFLSNASAAGPRFRLTYVLHGSVMEGTFELQMPGQSAWHPYLTWTGQKQL
ncbi:MAG: hypothetical protein PW735_04860 [Acidobacteriaceae bacterium]|nr:hypothetical protein [Acidobacteriaceae bacterium]